MVSRAQLLAAKVTQARIDTLLRRRELVVVLATTFPTDQDPAPG